MTLIKKLSAITLALVLTFSLVLSACSSIPVGNNGQSVGAAEQSIYGHWQLLELSAPYGQKSTAADSIIATQKATLSIASDGAVSGNDSCNGYFGSVSLTKVITNGNAELMFSGLGSTKRLCADMSVANGFLIALDKAKFYALENNTLTFYSADNLVIMQLSKAL